MARTKTYQAPYDRHGNLMHYPETQWWYDGEQHHSAPPDWRDPIAFTTHLTYQGFRRGRSAAYFEWATTAGQKFPMFLTDLDTLLRTCELTPAGITAMWIECKRGQNYGIQIVQNGEGPDHTTIELLRAETEARVDAALSHIRRCLHIGLQDAKLHGEAGRTRIGEWGDFIDEKIRHALHADEDNLRDVAAALGEASAPPPITSNKDI